MVEDNRGKFLFGDNPSNLILIYILADEERKFGLSIMRLVLECIQTWTTWFKDVKKSDGTAFGF